MAVIPGNGPAAQRSWQCQPVEGRNGNWPGRVRGARVPGRESNDPNPTDATTPRQGRGVLMTPAFDLRV